MKRYRNNDRVQQAIDITKLAMIGGVGYIGYKAYLAILKELRDREKFGNRSELKVSPIAQQETARFVDNIFTAAGYMSRDDFAKLNEIMVRQDIPETKALSTRVLASKFVLGGGGALVDYMFPGFYKKIIGTDKNMVTTVASSKMDEEAFKLIKDTHDKVMQLKIKLIDKYTDEQPDPRTIYKTKSPEV